MSRDDTFVLGEEVPATSAVRDPARLAALHATGLLDSATEEVFDRLSRLAVRLVGVPAAFLSLVDANRDFYKSACGFGEPLAATRELSGPTFCHFAIAAPGPLIIPDTAADPLYRDVPTVRTLGVAAYLGIPVEVGGQRVGSFCAIDTQPRAWTAEEVETLTELAASAQREIELRQALARADRLAMEGQATADGMRMANEGLTVANTHLQELAAELEAQAEELTATTMQLEDEAREAERARRMAEAERARATGILEATTDAYFALDEHFTIVAVNAAMERSAGLAREAMLGHVLWDLFPAAFGTKFERHYRAAMTEGTTAHFTESYNDDRLSLETEVDVYPIENGGIAVFWRDVTARVRADAERTQLLEAERAARSIAAAARDAAESANAAKSHFLSMMSHELRTPLNAIGGYTDLLTLGLRGPLNDAQHQDLDRIRRANRHMMALVTDVLNFARLDAGQLEYHLVEVEIASIVADLESLIGPQLIAKGLAFVHDSCASDRPGRSHLVRADPEKLRQILLNLLSNAVKFTDAGGSISIGCETSRETNVVQIQVRDTGRGIAAEQLGRIFEPFVQVDRHRTADSQQGIGLGLAISRDLARAMGGDITAESTLGGGSTFTLTLPAPRRAA